MRSSHAVGRLAPGEQDAILGTDGTWAGWQKRGIIFCHGAGDLFRDPFRDQHALLRGLSDFATVHVGDLGGDTWGNDIGVARVEAARQLLIQQGVSGPIGLVGMSMGNSVAMQYARQFPERVKALAGVIPLTSMASIRSILPGTGDAAFPNPVTNHWLGGVGTSASEQRDASGVALRKNRHPSPYPAEQTYWAHGGRNGARTVVSASDAIRPYLRVTCDTNANAAIALYSGTGNPGRSQVSPGEDLKFLAYGRHSVVGGVGAYLRTTFFDSAGAQGAQINGTAANLPTNAWEPRSMQVTVPAGAASARVDMYFGNSASAAIGDKYDMSLVLCCLASEPGTPYFDGNTAGSNRGYLEASDGPLRSPVRYAAGLLPGKSIALWSANDDPYTPHAATLAFQAARPATVVTALGNLSHTDAAVDAATPGIINFMRREMVAA